MPDESVWAAVAGGGAALTHSTTPEAYGATGNDPAHDDAPGIEAAIFAMAAACVADGSYICEVVFDAQKTYYAIRNPTYNKTINGVQSYANAQIALPYYGFTWVNPNTNKVVTLILRTSAARSYSAAGSETYNQQPGAAIVTTGTGTYSGGTNGVPSVIGGPAFLGTAPPQPWNGLNVVVDGLQVITAVNPTVTALDLNYCATCKIPEFHAYVPSQGYANPGGCSNGWAYGVILPNQNNIGGILIGYINVEGYFTAVSVAEHIDALALQSTFNRISLGVDRPGGDHGSHIGRLLSQQTTYVIAAAGTTNGTINSPTNSWVCRIGMIATEGVATIQDGNNQLQLDAQWWESGLVGNAHLVGGANVRAVQMKTARGALAAPAVPASGTAFLNANFHDAFVTVTGGTVSAIAIDGVATGLTAGQFVVPNNKTITLTYTVAPTWNWWLF